MFSGDSSLRTIYVYDTNLHENDEDYEPVPVYITAKANTDFGLIDYDENGEKILNSEKFLAEDFTFVLHYSDNTEEEIDIPNGNATFTKSSPAEIGKAGKATLTISIKGTSYDAYAHDKGTSTMGVHCDVRIIGEEEYQQVEVTDHAEYTLNALDDMYMVTIDVIKKDKDTGNTLGGAVIGVYANTDIKNHKGEVIVRAGTKVGETNSSEGSQFTASSFVGLPSNRYAASTGNMYYVQEVFAPAGYKPNNTKFYFSGGESFYDGNGGQNGTLEYTYEPAQINDEADFSLKKYWTPGLLDSGKVNNVSVQIQVMRGSTVLKTFTLNKSNNWMISLSEAGYEPDDFIAINPSSGTLTLAEKISTDAYVKVDEHVEIDEKNSKSIVCYFGNDIPNAQTTEKTIQKVWDDNNDEAEIHPEKVT